ncbi:MAG: CehA/McbA family metallohydrolase [Vicinamibacterales bacterium]
MKARLLTLTAAGLVAAGVFLSLPPRADVLPAGDRPMGDVRGVVHIHTRRSDGGGTVEDVARAAAQAGLRFAVLTDHGDGTRRPDPPAYLQGVLVIDAVEVTTFDGHVVALGIGQAPYRLGGRGADVVEDINRLGGFAVAAHVDSPKRSLRWRAWDAALTGFEWLNADSEWRDESRASLLGLLVPYPFRAPEALTRVLDRPVVTLDRWDEQSRTRRLVTIAAADAHARVGGSDEDDPRWWRRLSLPIPGYQPLFQTFSTVLTGVELTGDAGADAAAVLGAIRAGHSYTAVDALASNGWLRFRASGPGGSAGPGEVLPLAEGTAGPVHIEVGVPASAGARVRLLRDGALVREASGADLRVDVPAAPAAYRVEVLRPGAPGSPPVPWIVSNAIFIGRGAEWGRPGAAGADRGAGGKDAAVHVADLAAWAVERSERSQAAVEVVTSGGFRAALFRFALSGPESSGPFAAAALPLDGLGDADAIALRCHADRPMRVSVELRGPANGREVRWRRSVYLDETARDVRIPVASLVAAGPDEAPAPEARTVRSLLLVVDGVNTASGRSGQIWIEAAALTRRGPASGPDRQQ